MICGFSTVVLWLFTTIPRSNANLRCRPKKTSNPRVRFQQVFNSKENIRGCELWAFNSKRNGGPSRVDGNGYPAKCFSYIRPQSIRVQSTHDTFRWEFLSTRRVFVVLTAYVFRRGPWYRQLVVSDFRRANTLFAHLIVIAPFGRPVLLRVVFRSSQKGLAGLGRDNRC